MNRTMNFKLNRVLHLTPNQAGKLSKLVRRAIPVLVVTAVLVAGALFGEHMTSRAARPAMSDAMASALAGLNSPNALDRGNAVKALRTMRDPAAVPALMERLDDSDQAVGLYVAQALGDLAAPDSLPGLRNALKSEHADVRWRAAYALGAARDTGAVNALAGLLRDGDVTVQNNVALALAEIGTRDALSAVANGLGSPQASVTAAAMTALESAGQPAVAVLVSTLDTSKNALARQNAATTLGYIASPAAIPALQLALVDADPAVQSEAQWALDQIKLGGKS
jgi:HEAT repeat protein